jgi:hypothetical protein
VRNTVFEVFIKLNLGHEPRSQDGAHRHFARSIPLAEHNYSTQNKSTYSVFQFLLSMVSATSENSNIIRQHKSS